MIIGDGLLGLVILAVVGLIALSIVLTGVSMALHYQNVRRTRHAAALEATWGPRILDLVVSGGTIPASQMPRRDHVPFLEMLLRYARALQYPERRAVEAIAPPFLPALDSDLRHPDAFRRARALGILGELGFEGNEDRVLDGLSDESVIVAITAARELARRRRPEHLPALFASLARFDTWSPDYLASLLVNFGAAAAPRLRELAVGSGTPTRLRSIAVRALMRLNDLPTADAAAALMEAEDDPELQADLLRIVAKLGRPEHLACVRPLISSPTPHVRAAALRAVGALSDPREEEDVERLIAAMADPSPWVALHAGHALRALGHSDILNDLARSGGNYAALAGEVLGETA